jgi:hypothetical protein
MATMLEMLNANMREVLAHMQAFPGDKYAEKKYAILEHAIEANTPPAMSHMRPRAELPTAQARRAPPVQSPCQTCGHDIKCMDCKHTATPTILASAQLTSKKRTDTEWLYADLGRDFLAPDAADQLKEIAKEAAKPSYTFGADHEQDQLWLAAEREKVAGMREDRRTVSSKITGADYNPDNYMFPSSAFCLTDLANVRYGRLG